MLFVLAKGTSLTNGEDIAILYVMTTKWNKKRYNSYSRSPSLGKVLVTTLFLIALTAISVSCSDGSGKETTHPFTIVASFYPVYIMALNIVGSEPPDGITVIDMTPPITGCLHDYTLTAADMKRLETASVLIVNGAGMESFLQDIAQNTPALPVISLADTLPLIVENGVPNPHVWVSISLAVEEVKILGSRLEKLDPKHASLYERNAAAYIEKLESLRNKMKKALEPFKGRTIITFHEAFPYFAREFGLTIGGVVEREPGTAPSAKEIVATIEMIKSLGIRYVFSEPQYPSVAAETITANTGAKILVLDPAVTGEDSPDAYLNIMEENLVALVKGFTQ